MVHITNACPHLLPKSCHFCFRFNSIRISFERVKRSIVLVGIIFQIFSYGWNWFSTRSGCVFTVHNIHLELEIFVDLVRVSDGSVQWKSDYTAHPLKLELLLFCIGVQIFGRNCTFACTQKKSYFPLFPFTTLMLSQNSDSTLPIHELIFHQNSICQSCGSAIYFQKDQLFIVLTMIPPCYPSLAIEQLKSSCQR